MATHRSHRDRRGEFDTASWRWFGLAAALCGLGLLAWEAAGWWRSRVVPFPEAKSRAFQFQVPGRLEQLAPRSPARPTLADLPILQPTPVPGFEHVDWLKTPTLTTDLREMVYVSYQSDTSDDLFIAHRSAIDEAFQLDGPIDATASTARETLPAISPDGLELIFSRDGGSTTLFRTRRATRDAPFAAPVPLIIGGDPAPDWQHDAVQFLDARTLLFTVSNLASGQRSPGLAVRKDSTSRFQFVAPLPVADPWPRYFLAASGKRAYFPTAGGIALTGRAATNREFVAPECLVSQDIVGTHLADFDDTVWLSPQEDVVFYCAPRPEPDDARNRRLWMLRLR